MNTLFHSKCAALWAARAPNRINGAHSLLFPLVVRDMLEVHSVFETMVWSFDLPIVYDFA